MSDTFDLAAGERLTVWGVGTPRTLRVHWALQELALRYETRPVTPRSATARSAGYRAMNPTGKVPLLVDGAYTLTESGAIVGYLLRRYGAPRGLQPPTESRALGSYDEWASIALMELDAAAMYVLRRHLDLSMLHGTSPVAVAAARAYAVRVLESAAQRLGRGPHLLGTAFSGVDILFTTCLDPIRARGVVLPPTVADYHLRTTARPAYARAVMANQVQESDAPAAVGAESRTAGSRNASDC